VLQSAFAFETMMDNLAETLGLDRVELRRKNALRVGDETSTGQVMRESAGLVECIDKVEAEMKRLAGEGVDPFAAHPVPGAEHLIRTWGFASAFKNTGLGGGADDTSGAEVELYEDGSLQVRSAAAELGQGLVTIMQMMVAEEFSIPSSQVRVLVMDTDLTPNGGPTTASRQTYVTGNASRLAAITLREAISATLAEKYDLAPDKIRFSLDGVHVNGHTLNMREIYGEMKAAGKDPRVLYEYHAPQTKPLGQGGDMHVAFSFASQAAEVEVNTLTGEVRVLRVISANDVGRAINPLGLRGQVEGGVVMGVGHALLENFITKDGYVVTDRMSRYRIPSIMHTPEITAIIVEDPAKDGPYGAKGVGEIVLIPTPPAITNAIYNAVGVRFDYLPVDQEKLLWAMRENGKK
jgi:xanthine dehydrogenase molybdenum-binding subunit